MVSAATRNQADVLILGGGSAGYSCALRAAQLGLSVVLIEKGELGGTCLHAGCIPTKALLHAAEVADAVRDAERFGIGATLTGIDVPKMLQYKAGVVKKLHTGLVGLVKARGIQVIRGAGKVVGPREVEVNGERWAGKHLVLATGSRTRSLPGVEVDGVRVLTSDHALNLDRVPESVIVLGGGVIGSEFASVWRSFGAEVTIVEALPRILAGEDEAIASAVARAFRLRGIGMSTGTPVSKVETTDSGVRVHLETGDPLEAEILLVAVGRAPVTDGLGYEENGIAIDRGCVVVDERLRTTVPGIYAVGDIVAGLQLAHRGFAHGIFIAEEIAGLAPIPVRDELMPRVTYCEPEVASVGLSEAAARERHGDNAVRVLSYDLAGNGKSQILQTRGMVKLVQQVDGPVIGIHVVGARAGELIGEAQLATAWEAMPADVAPLLHAHPTQNEALGEAFLALAGKPLHAHG
ncbi:dihydrolipoyl dehydrogenase (plasmid) [Nocardioides sp. R1-1]|uniref:dihydrolipoyl dehydrogenase n=1 Tax=Nocardioides sp. R1-1 TaxID=3383502 RepID=UPI0038D21C41